MPEVTGPGRVVLATLMASLLAGCSVGVARAPAGPARTILQPANGVPPNLPTDAFGPGGPLRCSGLEMLTPAEFERAFEESGATWDLVWYVRATIPTGDATQISLTTPTGAIIAAEFDKTGNELRVTVTDPDDPLAAHNEDLGCGGS